MLVMLVCSCFRLIVILVFLLLSVVCYFFFFFFSSRRRHTRCLSDWSSDVCSSDLAAGGGQNRRNGGMAANGRGEHGAGECGQSVATRSAAGDHATTPRDSPARAPTPPVIGGYYGALKVPVVPCGAPCSNSKSRGAQTPCGFDSRLRHHVRAALAPAKTASVAIVWPNLRRRTFVAPATRSNLSARASKGPRNLSGSGGRVASQLGGS